MPHATSRAHDEAAIEGLRADPEYAVAYLNAILEDGDQQELLMALRRVAKAFGGIPKLGALQKTEKIVR